MLRDSDKMKKIRFLRGNSCLSREQKRLTSLALTAGILLGSLGFVKTSWSQEGLETDSFSAIPSDLSGHLGAGIIMAPEYIGADDQEMSLWPEINVSWRNTAFLRYDGDPIYEGEGIGYNFIRTPNASLAALVNYEGGRDSSDSPKLKGLDDIDASFQIGAYGDFAVDFFRVDGSLRFDVSNSTDGKLWDVGFSVGAALSPQFTSVVRIGLSGVDQNQADAMWGISEKELEKAVREKNTSIKKTYRPEAGLESINMSVKGSYRFTESFGVVGKVGVKRLIDVAESSPIVESKNAYSFGIALAVFF